MTLNFLALFFILLGTWLVLSGFFTPMFLALAVFSCALSVWLRMRMKTDQKDKPFLINPFRLISYTFWLIKEIFKSSYTVAKTVWQPRISLQPSFAWISTAQHSEVAKTIYANSITLTPGTISVVIRGNQIGVHALSQDGIDDLRGGEMDKRIVACSKEVV